MRIATGFACAAAVAILAGPAATLNYCGPEPASLDLVKLVQITGAGAAYFYQNALHDCPQAGDRCRSGAYVMPGDRVLVGEQGQGFGCASFINAKGVVSWGLIPLERLAPAPDEGAPAGLSAWTGLWRRTIKSRGRAREGLHPGLYAEIAIVKVPTGLKASADGSSIYSDAFGEMTASSGGFGVVDVPTSDSLHASKVARDGVALTLAGDHASLSADECQVGMKLVGGVLVVVENGSCSGNHFSLSGTYVHVGPVARP
jgi:hypothetical protein